MSAHLLVYALPLRDINDNVIVGGTIEFFESGGSSTPKEVWSDSSLSTSAGTTVDTDAYGLPEKSATSIEVYGDGDYYVKYKDSSGTVIRDYEWLEEIFTQTEPDEWVTSNLTPTYISATQFSVTGDQTEILDVGRILKIQLSSSIIYRKINVSAYTTLTTITVATGLTSPITSFEYSFQNGTNQSVPDPINAIDLNVSNDLTVGNNAIITGDVDAATGTIDALTADSITAEILNGDLALDGNGTGIVTTDAISATTLNADLALTGNGTGEVTIDGASVGNATTEIPLNNTTLNVDLNSEFHNGLYVQSGTGTIAGIAAGNTGTLDITFTDITQMYGAIVIVDDVSLWDSSYIDDTGYGAHIFGAAIAMTAPAANTLRIYGKNNTAGLDTLNIRYIIYGT